MIRGRASGEQMRRWGVCKGRPCVSCRNAETGGTIAWLHHAAAPRSPPSTLCVLPCRVLLSRRLSAHGLGWRWTFPISTARDNFLPHIRILGEGGGEV